MVKKEEAKNVPEPIIKIDNHTDPYHTIVSITYGDKLGELTDTVQLLSPLASTAHFCMLLPVPYGSAADELQ